jgi:D-hexose-6-phosphate mutarotase
MMKLCEFRLHRRDVSVDIKRICLIKLTRKVRQVSMHLQEIDQTYFRIENIYQTIYTGIDDD